MKKYYSYVTKDMHHYYEYELKKHGVIIISRELVKDIHDGEELYYYIVKAKDGIIDPKWEIEGA